jgi:hypothetical protein
VHIGDPPANPKCKALRVSGADRWCKLRQEREGEILYKDLREWLLHGDLIDVATNSTFGGGAYVVERVSKPCFCRGFNVYADTSGNLVERMYHHHHITCRYSNSGVICYLGPWRMSNNGLIYWYGPGQSWEKVTIINRTETGVQLHLF